jgi:hypothetical protein
MKRKLMLALAAATALLPAAAIAQDQGGGREWRRADNGARAAARAERQRDSGVALGGRPDFQRSEPRPAFQRPERPQGDGGRRFGNVRPAPGVEAGARVGGWRRDGGAGVQAGAGAQAGGWQRPDRPRGDWQRDDQPRGTDGPRRGFAGRPEGQRPDRPQWQGQAPQGANPGQPGWQRPGAAAERDRWIQQRQDRAGRDWNRGDGRPGNAADRDRFLRERQERVDRDGRRDGDRRGQWNQGDRRWYGDNNWGRDRDRGDWNRNRGDRGGWNVGGYNRGGWDRDWRRDRRYDWRGYRQSNRNLYRLPRYYAPSGYYGGYRRFGIGFTLSSVLFAPDYWIDDPFSYRLPDADGPYRWVRYYNDALLVDLETGEVVDVEYDIFW